MRTGQIKYVLVDDNIEAYETVGISSLLSPDNFRLVRNYQRNNPPGEYTEKFIDDLAIAYIKVTEVIESSVTHRRHRNLDVAIAKFGPEDYPALFNLALEKYSLFERLKTAQQNNGHQLRNPLPTIMI